MSTFLVLFAAVSASETSASQSELGREVADVRRAVRLDESHKNSLALDSLFAPVVAGSSGDALVWLEASQNPSGSWGSTYEFVDTATVVETLGQTDPDSLELGNGASWLAGQPAVNYEYLARQITALVGVSGYGEYAGTLAGTLWAVRNPAETDNTLPNWPDGGWGLAEGYETDCLTTGVALQAIKAAGRAGGVAAQDMSIGTDEAHLYELDIPDDALKVRISIEAAGNEVRLRMAEGEPPSLYSGYFSIVGGPYLITLPDDGLPFVPGHNYVSIQCPSGPATYSLHVSYDTPGWDTRETWDPYDSYGIAGEYGPLEYLAQSQNPDGGWGLQRGGDSELYTTLHCLLALDDYSHYGLEAERSAAVAYLCTRQLPDGSFGYGGTPLPYVTALASLAMIRAEAYPFSSLTENAMAALLAMQDLDGSWDQEPYDTALAVHALWDHNQTPVVDAGDYVPVVDADLTCGEEILLQGVASDVDGTIEQYVWYEGDRVLGTGASLTVALTVGTHTITLAVTDDGGKTATDTAEVRVVLPPEMIFEENMDSDPGWSTEGLWQWGIPQGHDGLHGSGLDGSDPTSGYTGNNVYGYNLAGGYEDDLLPTYLTTPSIDCTGYTGVTLRFWRWLNVEESGFDHASIEVSSDPTDPASWVMIWDHQGSTLIEKSWSLQEYDISAIADEQPLVAVRWVMGSSDYAWNFGGWNIDDVQLYGTSAWGVPSLPGDIDQDCDVDMNDLWLFEACASGPAVPMAAGCEENDFDSDEDVDQSDFAIFQRCFSGAGRPADPGCAE